MSRLVMICDGNNLVYRCASVMNLTTKSGFSTGGIYGTLTSISSYIRDLEKEFKNSVSEIIVVFDGGRSKRRKALYPDYKANRKVKSEKTPEEQKWYEDFLKQTEILKDSLPLLGVKTIQVKGEEADDVMFGLIRTYEKESDNFSFVLVSTDEDFFQLIDENCSIYSPTKKSIYTNSNFEEIFGCSVENFLSYKILKGDSSDNINGIDGIGDVTSKKLVNTYGGLIGILNPVNRDLLMKSKVSKRIFTPEGLSLLDRNNKLINLNDFVDTQDYDTELLDVLNSIPVVEEKLVREFLMKYQMSSILVDFKNWINPYKSVCESFFCS